MKPDVTGPINAIGAIKQPDSIIDIANNVTILLTINESPSIFVHDIELNKIFKVLISSFVFFVKIFTDLDYLTFLELFQDF